MTDSTLLTEASKALDEVQPRRVPIYTAYRASGVDWVGTFPEHWELRRLKYLARMRSGMGITAASISDTGDVPVYGGNGLRGFKYGHTHDGEFVLIGRQGALCGNVHHVVGRFWASEHAVVATCNSDVVARWFAYLIDAMQLNRYSVSAAQPGLSVEQVLALPAPFPAPQEQQGIAAFLDRETAKIDGLVAKKRRLIELLKEKRSALISHAVTKGLNPDAPMKPSGIDWLGDVPEHWDVMRLKHIARIGNGSTPSRENPEYWHDGTYPWLNSSVVNLPYVTEGSDFVTNAALRECHLPRIAPPAVLVGITGEGKTRGMATVLRIEATINQHLAFVKPTTAAKTAYVHRLFDPLYTFLRSESDGGGSTKGAITCDQLANIKVPYPPHDEQMQIAERLERETLSIETLADKVAEVIGRLEEYRSALISAAVTGKIDVRGEV